MALSIAVVLKGQYISIKYLYSSLFLDLIITLLGACQYTFICPIIIISRVMQLGLHLWP